MKFVDIELPSNKKFGYFFSVVFATVGVYFFLSNKAAVSFLFLLVTLAVLVATLFRSDYLLPFNRMWMGFALLLGTIVSPIVLGVIFFGLFTPISLISRLFNRDELQLRIGGQKTYWITRKATESRLESFETQF